jgi:serine/threonine protein phosphatase PrpC
MIPLLSYCAHSNQGPYLQTNEDGACVDLVNRLFMVFDGFGGSNIGDRCVATLQENIRKFYLNIGGDPDSTLPFYYSPKYLIEGNALVNSLHYAHGLLKADNQQRPMAERAGASVIVGALAENVITLASSGNCKSYLYRNGRLHEVNRPDSLELFSSDDYQKHFHTAPLSGLGLFDDLHLHVHEIRLCKDDILLLLTDGVYARIGEEELIHQLLKKHENNGQKVQEIFDLANARGNLDNQTCLLLQF